MTWHVFPANDLKEHNVEESTCDCNPRCEVLESGDMMIVHNSFDGREGIEIVNQILKLT